VKRGVIATFLALLVFGGLLALGVLGLAVVGKVTSSRQAVQVEQARAETAKAQAEVAHEQRLEAEVRPETIQENWEGLTQHLLVVGQVERDREITTALIRLATAELNKEEQARTFGYTVAALAILFIIGRSWWIAAQRAVRNG